MLIDSVTAGTDGVGGSAIGTILGATEVGAEPEAGAGPEAGTGGAVEPAGAGTFVTGITGLTSTGVGGFTAVADVDDDATGALAAAAAADGAVALIETARCLGVRFGAAFVFGELKDGDAAEGVAADAEAGVVAAAKMGVAAGGVGAEEVPGGAGFFVLLLLPAGGAADIGLVAFKGATLSWDGTVCSNAAGVGLGGITFPAPAGRPPCAGGGPWPPEAAAADKRVATTV
jgi:hypothetical protein